MFTPFVPILNSEMINLSVPHIVPHVISFDETNEILYEKLKNSWDCDISDTINWVIKDDIKLDHKILNYMIGNIPDDNKYLVLSIFKNNIEGYLNIMVILSRFIQNKYYTIIIKTLINSISPSVCVQLLRFFQNFPNIMEIFMLLRPKMTSPYHKYIEQILSDTDKLEIIEHLLPLINEVDQPDIFNLFKDTIPLKKCVNLFYASNRSKKISKKMSNHF